MSEQQTDELACHTANLKVEVVKGIIQRSEFNPKLAKHAQCVASIVSNHNSLKRTRKVLSTRATCFWKINTNHIIFSSLCSVNTPFALQLICLCVILQKAAIERVCCCRGAVVCWVMWRWTKGIHKHRLLAVTRVVGLCLFYVIFFLNKC